MEGLEASDSELKPCKAWKLAGKLLHHACIIRLHVLGRSLPEERPSRLHGGQQHSRKRPEGVKVHCVPCDSPHLRLAKALQL